MSPAQPESVLRKFDERTTCNNYTVVVFCSFLQLEPFKKVLKSFLSVSEVTRSFWYKDGLHPGQQLDQQYNVIECFLVGYQDKESKLQGKPGKKASWQHDYQHARAEEEAEEEEDTMTDVEDDDDDHLDSHILKKPPPRSNFYPYKVVRDKLKSGGKVFTFSTLANAAILY